MTDRMRLAELQEIIQAAGGKYWALGYAEALLEKINRLEAVGGYVLGCSHNCEKRRILAIFVVDYWKSILPICLSRRASACNMRPGKG